MDLRTSGSGKCSATPLARPVGDLFADLLSLPLRGGGPWVVGRSHRTSRGREGETCMSIKPMKLTVAFGASPQLIGNAFGWTRNLW
jgi:hypothetical protein